MNTMVASWLILKPSHVMLHFLMQYWAWQSKPGPALHSEFRGVTNYSWFTSNRISNHNH